MSEYHVSTTGNDTADGTIEFPLRTISAAAERAHAGDVVTVHEGTYRERITPPRGGESEVRRIVYQASPGERVEIKGSEIVRAWRMVDTGVWMATLPNVLFGTFNPFADPIRGDWFLPKDREHHTGAVYLNGEALREAATLDGVPDLDDGRMRWFAQVDDATTTIWANFGGADPSEGLVEVNCRQSVFYPDRPGCDYITVRGFVMSHAATPWAPPTAEQIGLIGTHWSKGWVIEDNVISHSRCTGITLGKFGDGHDNTDPTPEGMYTAIHGALDKGWDRDHIGGHVVRRNTISHCEMAGIAGSMGASFSTITENTVHDIHMVCDFDGYEMAGIKLHGGIDTLISKNRIYRTVRGVWLDWMSQGTRVSGNLFHDNTEEDLFVEVNHGPFVVDQNLFLSGNANIGAINHMSQGLGFVHNLCVGRIFHRAEPERFTPYHLPHSTRITGNTNIESGDDRYYNNVFVALDQSSGLSDLVSSPHPTFVGGNVFLNGASPSEDEHDPVVATGFDCDVTATEDGGSVVLTLRCDPEWKHQTIRELVTTKFLGLTRVAQLPYEDTDGSPLTVDTDYFGHVRDSANPFPGPFEIGTVAETAFRVWPL